MAIWDFTTILRRSISSASLLYFTWVGLICSLSFIEYSCCPEMASALNGKLCGFFLRRRKNIRRNDRGKKIDDKKEYKKNFSVRKGGKM